MTDSMLAPIKRRINNLSVQKGFKKSHRTTINNHPIKFHNIKSSHLLKLIASSGFDSYEPETLNLIKNYPFTISSFIDAGANIGFFSIAASLYLPPTVNVVAIEPFPQNVQYMRQLQDKNNLSFDILPFALTSSDTQQTAELYYPTAKSSSKLSSSATLINEFKGSNGTYNHLDFRQITVDVTTLKKILSPDKFPCLIKIDCEGAELEILRASQTVLERNDIDFIIEIRITDQDKHDIFSLMTSHGYSAYLITNAGLIREDRPLTLPYYNKPTPNRSCWKNHFFTKKNVCDIKQLSKQIYGQWI